MAYLEGQTNQPRTVHLHSQGVVDRDYLALFFREAA